MHYLENREHVELFLDGADFSCYVIFVGNEAYDITELQMSTDYTSVINLHPSQINQSVTEKIYAEAFRLREAYLQEQA